MASYVIQLRKMLPTEFADILESYLSSRAFIIRHGNAYSEIKEIEAGVPQGSVLGPVLYLIYTCDIPILETTPLQPLLMTLL